MKNEERRMKNEELHRFFISFFRLLILSFLFLILHFSLSQSACGQDAIAAVLVKDLG